MCRKMNHSLVEAGLLDEEILQFTIPLPPLPDGEGAITSTQLKLANRNTQGNIMRRLRNENEKGFPSENC